ncbi:MAG: GNAT family N-acetyltransferase [Thermotogae bacterium]|nr:GNAT family N-acetyltransferase [Thermotogota bacterium]
MLDLILFSERLAHARRVEMDNFWGVERRRFLLRTFLSFPYTIATPQRLEPRTLAALKGRYHRGEIALTYPHRMASISLVAPAVRGRPKYHRERRRLIRRAEERCEITEPDFTTFYALYSETAKARGRRPIPEAAMRRIYRMRGVDVIGVSVDGRTVGAIMNLALKDRYLLWQMGWNRDFAYLPTYLLHLSITAGLERGYDLIDLGISPPTASLKLKREMGGDTDRRIYVIRWDRLGRSFVKWPHP